MSALAALLHQEAFSDADMIRLIGLTDPADCEQLRQAAYDLTTRLIGGAVHYRGIVEFSNRCTLNCRYCGIRRDNRALERYALTKEQVIASARWAAENRYGSVCLQAGERRDLAFIAFVADCIREIRTRTVSERLPEGASITLSLGEQSPDTYRRWREAGGESDAMRYLLRMETSNPTLFARLHPHGFAHEKAYESRIRALEDLRAAGFQVGTGGMIGLPGQTLADLCADIRFYQRLDVDMLGMGPYILSQGADLCAEGMMETQPLLQRSLNMLAVCRLVLRDVNIAAATALQALAPDGRELGIAYGCNILMPNITPRAVRSRYQLYDNKPCIEDEPTDCRACLEGRIRKMGRRVGWDEWGCSRHFRRRSGLPLAVIPSSSSGHNPRQFLCAIPILIGPARVAAEAPDMLP
jgi:biotin synthase